MPAAPTADPAAVHLDSDAPLPGGQRGRVLLVHGLGEHAGRYEALAAMLRAQGWAVSRYDHAGHGRSPGRRGVLPSDDALLAGLGAVVDRLPAHDPPGPRVLLGHSLGGLVAARFVAEGLAARPAPWWRPVQALVLSSPALDVGMNPLQRALVALLAPRWPDLTLSNGLSPQWISRSPQVVQAYTDDPLVHDRISPRLARFFLQAGAEVLAAAPRWNLPTLLQVSGADRCVRPAGSEAFARAAPARHLTVHRYPELAHEIYNEPERDQVLEHLGAWLTTQAALPPAPR